MKIEISDIKDNKSVPLLAEIIKISQNEIDTLKGSVSSMRSKKENLDGQVSAFLEETNALFAGKVSTLEEAKGLLKDSVSSMRSEKETLDGHVSAFLEETNALFAGKVSTLEEAKDLLKDSVSSMRSEKATLDGQVSAFLEETNALFESKTSTLEEAKDLLKDSVSSMRSEKATLDGQVSTFLEEANILLESKAFTLEDVKSQIDMLTHNVLKDKLNTFVQLLNISIKELKDDIWEDYITNIVLGLSDTLKSTDKTADTLFKIQEKNGWLTKLASLYWWSNESHVKKFVPSCLGEESMFNYLFMDFISYLKSRGIQINLPSGDFSNKVPMYKPDYDEETSSVKNLFPQYKPDDFVLCEISFLSIKDNTGKCIGIR